MKVILFVWILLLNFVSAQTVSEQKPRSNSFHKGYRGIFQIGYGFKTGEIGTSKTEFDLINGYQTNKYFSIGLGVGYRDLSEFQQKQMPVYLHIRGYFSDAKVSPYAALSLGYTFDLKNDFNPLGVFIYPNAGVSIVFPKNMAINFGIGYEIQMLEFVSRGYYSYSNYSDAAQAIALNIGFSF